MFMYTLLSTIKKVCKFINMLCLNVFPKVAVINIFFHSINLLLYRGIITGFNADHKITKPYYMEFNNFKLRKNVKLN